MPTRTPSAPRTTLAILTAGALLLTTAAASAQTPYAQVRVGYRNPGMRIAGIVLTAIGSATLVAGAVIFATDIAHNTGGEDDGRAAFLVGMPMMAGSALFAGIGIPLWVVGARPAVGSAGAPAWAGAAGVPAWVPSVAAAPRGGSLRWTF